MLRVSAQVGEFGMGEGIMQAVCWINMKYDVCVCVLCAWVCLTCPARLVEPVGAGCPSEYGSDVQLRQK